MILLVPHIAIAITSLIVTTLTAALPSRNKVNFSALLISLTLVSGTLLVILTHQPILSSCLTGVTYLAAAMAGVIIGVKRLAKQEANN